MSVPRFFQDSRRCADNTNIGAMNNPAFGRDGIDERTSSELTPLPAGRPYLCVACGATVVIVEDWIGGGSHYWMLKCNKCGLKHQFDTYRFKLEAMSRG